MTATGVGVCEDSRGGAFMISRSIKPTFVISHIDHLTLMRFAEPRGHTRRNHALADAVAVRELPLGYALSARRLRASSCCASVSFGLRPMRCPRFCARCGPRRCGCG